MSRVIEVALVPRDGSLDSGGWKSRVTQVASSPRRGSLDSGVEAGDERGQVTLLILGFVAVILLVIAVVVDASAAYLQRQAMDNLADGAAIAAADAGANGETVYADGVSGERMELDQIAAYDAARDHLADVRAGDRYGGLKLRLVVSSDRVIVQISALTQLPIAIPGVASPRISSTGSASVFVSRP